MNQDKRIALRLNENEYQKLATSASTYGLSVGRYVKRIALGSHLRKPLLSHEAQQAVIRELSKQGANINQIAKYVNTHNDGSIDTQALAHNLDVMREEYGKLWQLLQK